MKNIVIIGGGFAGTKAAKSLENKFNVTLIDLKDYFEFTPSILRAFVNLGKLKKIRIKHKNYLRKTKIIVGKATKIKDYFVYINNKKIEYDYLIIATGAKYVLPLNSNNVVNASSSEDLVKYRPKLLKAREIGIVGGGLVGVELAEEIIENFPEKKINLVDAESDIMLRYNPKSKSIVKKDLIRKKANFYFNQRVINYKNNIIITDKNEKIRADLLFFAIGIKPNSEDFKGFLELNKGGYIKVNNQLQSKKNIFTIGDVNSIEEEKTAQAAEKQAKIAVKNILNIEHNKKLLSYKNKKRPLLISLGKWNVILEHKSLVLYGKLPALIKYLVELKTILKLKY